MDDPHSELSRLRLLADLSALSKQAQRGLDCPWEPDARQAFARVFDRYRLRIFAYVNKRVVQRLNIQVDPDEFVPDLFMRFVRSADKFKPANSHSFVDVERQFLYTLHQHARWMVKDLLEEAQQGVDLLHQTVRELADLRAALSHDPSPQHIERLRRLELALSHLDPRARDVVVTSSPYYSKDEGRFLVPAEIRAALKTKWNFHSDNDLVQCRKRSIASLHEIMGHVA